ncbi:hypothetical protein BAZSYMA_ACONTIG14240_1 [Bathymodiolus azoricus thioautotrophic gill symbiont]|uniref:Uncharacterized protein n=1 Tax=Bathymodiolus azoricus thioautotrophic gill symbiont TaxID=235205 RepID=A0A1H6MJN8_9GAMM|nr:hypothetical protein BAZSYMA_ACONTIG14240_1 [Bathymodiolus azoricus thioautotrophic gill symbiont]
MLLITSGGIIIFMCTLLCATLYPLGLFVMHFSLSCN